jgi:transcriptional regulator with XRE-family HTH domain
MAAIRRLKSKQKRCPNPPLAEFLRLRRQAANVPLGDIARYVGDGISLETLESYESGAKPIPLHIVYSFANCLGIPPREILDLLHCSRESTKDRT